MSDAPQDAPPPPTTGTATATAAPTAAHPLKQRSNWLVLLVVAVALGSGSWLRLSLSPPADTGSDRTEVSGAVLFEQTYTDAQGQEQAMSQFRGRWVVVNFWATWCPPCVEEMPELQRVRQDYQQRGIEIVGLAVDTPDNVRRFAPRGVVSYPLLVAGANGSDLARSLGNLSAALPFTALVRPDGTIVQRKLGRIHESELRQWLDAALATAR